MSHKVAQYIIVDPKTNSEIQFVSLVSAQQVSQGPALILRIFAQKPMLEHEKNLIFRKIHGGSDHPVDTKFELGYEYLATKWSYEKNDLEIFEYQKVST